MRIEVEPANTYGLWAMDVDDERLVHGATAKEVAERAATAVLAKMQRTGGVLVLDAEDLSSLREVLDAAQRNADDLERTSKALPEVLRAGQERRWRSLASSIGRFKRLVEASEKLLSRAHERA